MLRPTTATITRSAESLSNMVTSGFHTHLDQCGLAALQKHKWYPPSPPALFHISCWWISFQAVPFRYFVSHFYTLSQWHPASFPRAALRRVLLLPTQKGGGWGLHFLLQPKQRILSQPSYLCLKMQIHQRTKGKGWGLLKSGFWAIICPKKCFTCLPHT